jgi:hypothetical protein
LQAQALYHQILPLQESSFEYLDYQTSTRKIKILLYFHEVGENTRNVIKD